MAIGDVSDVDWAYPKPSESFRREVLPADSEVVKGEPIMESLLKS